MKTKLFILIFIISSFRIFASNSLEVTYKTDNIRINYFLGYQKGPFKHWGVDLEENSDQSLKARLGRVFLWY